MVPKLKGELRPPPPPARAELWPAEPWELCSTASTKEASIAADVRRWGGGVLPAHVLVGGTDFGHVGRHGVHLDRVTTRHRAI